MELLIEGKLTHKTERSLFSDRHSLLATIITFSTFVYLISMKNMGKKTLQSRSKNSECKVLINMYDFLFEFWTYNLSNESILSFTITSKTYSHKQQQNIIRAL
jgi:hypothetical protein